VTLPALTDSDKNDVPMVVIGKMEAQEEKFPPFLHFDNKTNVIYMNPNSKYYAGRVYYFTIVVKESNSDSVKYPYYCTVKMTGDKVEYDNSIDYTDVNYTISMLNEDSKGTLFFTSPVNLTFLAQNNSMRFHEMFNIFWRDTTYRTNNKNHTLLDFEVDSYGEDN